MRRMRKFVAFFLCMQLLCGPILMDAISAQENSFALTAVAEEPEGESFVEPERQTMEQQSAETERPPEEVTVPPKPEETMKPTGVEKEAETRQPEGTQTPKSAETERPPETVTVTPKPEETMEPTEAEKKAETMPPEGAQTPMDTEKAADVEVPAETEEFPEDIEEEEDWIGDAEEEPGFCDVLLGEYKRPSAAPGEEISLAIPIHYINGNQTYQSNADGNGRILPHKAEYLEKDYNQEIATVLPQARIAILGTQSSRFPLAAEGLTKEESVIENGINRGYAVFENARIREDAEPGSYSVRLLATWMDQEGQEHTKKFTIRIKVSAPEEDEESETDVEGEAQEDLSLKTGVVSLGEYEATTSRTGRALTLALPIQYTRGEEVYHTNQSAQGTLLEYEDSLPSEAYDQSLTDEILELKVAIADDQGENCPLAPEAHSFEQRIIADGENRGFASFEEIPILEEAESGVYSVRLNVSWMEADSEEWRTAMLTASINVEASARPLAEDNDSMALGPCDPFSARPGDTAITLAIPLTYRTIQNVYNEETDSYETVEMQYDTNADTNADGEEKRILPYDAQSVAGSYDQAVITAKLMDVSIELTDAQSANCPLDLTEALAPRILIADGENMGYAVFEDVPLVAGLSVGTYPVKLEVSWQSAEIGARTEEVVIYVNISSGGALLYGENGIIVFTHAQLKSALQSTVTGYSGRHFNPIYLGYCGTDMPDGSWETRNNGVIRYPTAAADARIPVTRNVTIIGTDPRSNTRMKVIDRAIIYSDTPSYASSGIYTNVADIAITVRDVEWEGHNQNGIVMGYYRSGAEFINVDYTGSRMFASEIANSWVIINNCRAHITDMNSGVNERGQEVAKTGDIRLYGKNTITRDGYVSGIWYAVFWVNVAPYKVTVYPGAKVTVDSNNYFLRENVPASSILDVQGTLDVTTRNNNGGMTYAAEYINNVTVNGWLKIRHYGTGYDCLRAGTLIVSGSLDIEKMTGSSSDSCLAIYLGTASFNSPKFVSLKNPGGTVIRAAELHTGRTLKITTQVMNRWPLTDASMTKYIWNNNDLGFFTVNATFGGVNTSAASQTGLTGGTGVSLNASQINTTSFKMNNTTRLEFGEYSAFIDPQTVYFGSGSIRGSAPKGSTQTVEEYLCPGGILGSRIQSVSAVGDMSYRTGEDWNPVSTVDSRVYVLSRRNELEAHIYSDGGETLALHYVPATLDFGTVSVSGESQRVRPAEDWKVQVLDTRAMGSWVLSVTAAPLASEDGQEILTDALVFIRQDGTKQPLSPTSVIVAEKQLGDTPGIVDLNWGEDRGIQLELSPYDGTPGMSYATVITWTLEDV